MTEDVRGILDWLLSKYKVREVHKDRDDKHRLVKWTLIRDDDIIRFIIADIEVDSYKGSMRDLLESKIDRALEA